MPPLRTHQRLNVGLVLLVGQAVQILLVTLHRHPFLLLVGMIAVTEVVRESWIGRRRNGLALVHPRRRASSRSPRSCVKVAGGLASFSGLYFAVAMLTDATYREEFLDEMTAGLQSAFQVRSEYLRLRDDAAGQNPAS